MAKSGKKPPPPPTEPPGTEAPTAHAARTTGATHAHASAVDVNALDAAHDGDRPDAAVDVLCVHAEALATTVRLHEEQLALAKLPPGSADRLEALTLLLRAQQTTWTTARAALSTEDLGTARSEAVEARGDLFAALRFFTSDRPAAQRILDEVAPGDDDADTLQDIHTLLELAKTHADALAGTDMPPARVADVRTKGERFRKLLARSGAATAASAKGDGDAGAGDDEGEAGALGQGALTKQARAALGLRNRVFWALSALDRQACACGRYAFRKDPKVLAAFGAYATRAPKKPAK